ncbi:Oidioi.mRNA.OKI2018_I69.XSR.g14228.t2.cds [Oikopleura dioica]|uniref:Oidioi.mRNA.OKI2018_I69.XSR.g14228.t2.cds n=1 Tax=Oikopleura dioica TaxID=34765 RepID=A0ABN7S958_OIKDI|nr:Oidioi.mRNA.OKI2018_I69.XSR.g14228.t2.cds [Oikopleura dioica]
MQSLLFINSVCELAEQQVCESLLSYLHSGFLVPVLAPSLHKPNQEETLCSIAYLDLFVRSVTSEPLLKLLLRFIVLHEYEGVPLLDTLTQTLGSNHRECLAALSLFSTLISIQCEDLMFQLIFRYLIPGSHMLWTQRGLIRQNENLVISAEKFLNLTPKESFKGKNSGTNFRITEDLFLSADETAEIDEADEELVATDLALVGAVPGAIDQIPFSYMDYLEDASARIAESRLSCATWLYDYDGIDPPPNFISENTDLFTPLHGLVATRTHEALVNFDIENNDLPSLDELGIESITSKPQSFQRANSTSNQAKVFEKVERPRNNKVKTEVDDFYRSLMNSEELMERNIKCQYERVRRSGPVAVEAQMNSSLGEANSEVESFELPSTAETVEELETVCEENANERSILELGHLEEQLTTLGDHFLDAQASTTIHVPIKKAGTPFLGPFLSTLFGRLEQMPTNSLYLNLMLTGVVTKLCSMPQPLLRGFLLDTRVVFQPGVPTLFSVLTKVKGKLNAFAVSCADFNSLCARANQFLLQREEDPIIIEDDKGSSTPFDLKKFENVIKGKKDKAEKFIKAAQLNLAMREKHSSDPLRLKNGIFATVILREFAKELAALAHEHAILY